MGALNARSTIRGPAAVAMALVGVAVAVVLLTAGGEEPPERTGGGSASGQMGRPVWDGDVRFELQGVDCSAAKIQGGEGRPLDPEGNFCEASFTLLNLSKDDVLLPRVGHLLTAAGRQFPTSERAMDVFADIPGSLYDVPVPPGGGGTGRLYFDVPTSARPTEVELHARTGSAGARVRLDGCSFSRSGGAVIGGCYPRGPHEPAEKGVQYPHTISGPRGGSALFYVCFDRREWEVVDPYPTAGVPDGFVGQGVMTLIEPERAVFKDNSGAEMFLETTAANDEVAGLCG